MTLSWTAAVGAPIVGAGALDFDVSAILMWGVFFLVMVFSIKLVIEPYLRVRQARDERTAGSRQEAEEKARRAEEILARYEAELAQARRDAAAVRDSLRGQGVAEQGELIERARQDAARRLASERAEIRERVERAKAEMGAKAESLADRMVRRVLGLSALFLFALAPMSAEAAAGAEGHHGFPWLQFAAAWVNFAIFAAILYKFAVPKMRDFFAARRELLSANLEEARRLREEAEARLVQYQGRLDELEAEREALLEEYNRQGEREKERIVREASEHAAKLRADAELLVEQEIKKAKADLERVVVDEAIRRAMERAEVELARPGAQKRLIDRYVGDLESMAEQSA